MRSIPSDYCQRDDWIPSQEATGTPVQPPPFLFRRRLDIWLRAGQFHPGSFCSFTSRLLFLPSRLPLRVALTCFLPPCASWVIETLCSNTSEKATAPHSSTLAWKIPRMEEPGSLQSMGSQSLTQLSDYDRVRFLSTRDYHNIVNWLYSNIK